MCGWYSVCGLAGADDQEWFGHKRGRERSRSSRDAHLSDDKAVAKMGHPEL